MSIHQCDIFRGRREANYLRRSAQLIRSSVGPSSCTRRLNVDDEFRLLLSGSGPCFISKSVRCGALPVRRVGKMYYDKDFVDVLLRRLSQTGSRTQMALNRTQCDIQLCVSVLGHIRAIMEEVVESQDVSAWKQALYEALHSSSGFRVIMMSRKFQARVCELWMTWSITTLVS